MSLYMSGDPLTVAPDADLGVAARTMAEKGVRCLPVVAAGSLVGVLSRTDLLRTLPADVQPFSPELLAGPGLGVKVQDAMTADVVTIAPGDGIERAVALLDERRLSCLVVVRDGEVVGVLSRSDILRAFRRLVFDEGATRLSMVVPVGVDVVARAAGRGKVFSYAEHEHDAGRLVLVSLCASVADVDALQEELLREGARLLHRAAPLRT